MRLSYILVQIFLIAFGFSLMSSCKEKQQETVVVEESGNAALNQLNELIKKDSLNPSLLFERAKLYYENNYLDGAISDLERAVTLDSMQAPYYHLLSDAYMDYFLSKDALSTMEKCAELFPERIPTLLKLSETQLILKQYDASLQSCSNILVINPQNAEAYFMMGMNLRSVGDLDRAKNAFRKATELDPELTDAWIILGQMFEDEGNPKAIEYYDAAINVDRDNPVSWHSKAYYMQNNDRIDEALEIYRTINTIDKDYLDAYLNSGVLYMSLDSFEQARTQFDIMCKIKPQFYLAYYYRGLANESMEKLDQAKGDYQTALKLNAGFERAASALEKLKTKQES